METGKPVISILMAVYEPRMDWLKEQLDSLEAQTYPALRLYIRDDCSPTVPLEEIESCVHECIRSFPYQIYRNEENLGSNKTFEQLTQEAEGEYFAYCDQDDVWLPEKLAVLQEKIERTSALLVCSDMFIIDGKGMQTADSITKVRRHHTFRSGSGLAEGLLISNFVTGCTMLIRSREAKAAVPFCPDMVHDHYLALYTAVKGEILSLPERLVRYRIHGANQTGLMAGVDSRESYLAVRISTVRRRLEWLNEWLPDQSAAMKCAIEERLQWVRAREQNLRGQGGKKAIWKYRRFGPRVSAFELIAPLLPEPVFLYIVNLARNNRL